MAEKGKTQKEKLPVYWYTAVSLLAQEKSEAQIAWKPGESNRESPDSAGWVPLLLPGHLLLTSAGYRMLDYVGFVVFKVKWEFIP